MSYLLVICFSLKHSMLVVVALCNSKGEAREFSVAAVNQNGEGEFESIVPLEVVQGLYFNVYHKVYCKNYVLSCR